MSDTEVYLSDNDKSEISSDDGWESTDSKILHQTCPQLQNSKINGKIVYIFFSITDVVTYTLCLNY